MNLIFNYIQLCLEPAEGIAGPLIAATIKQVTNPTQTPWVAASDIDAAGAVGAQLFVPCREIRVFKMLELLDQLDQAEQVVWATMCFCTTKDAAFSIRGDEPYPVSARKAAITIRVVDATYIYIIAPHDIAADWPAQFPSAEVKIGPIDQMDFPE